MFGTKHLKSNRLQKRCYLNRQRLQTTTNHHKRSQTTSKQPHTTKIKQPMTTKHEQTTTNYQQTNTNYQQTTTKDHPGTSNRKSDVSFLLLAPGNYKKHPDFENHTLHSAT